MRSPATLRQLMFNFVLIACSARAVSLTSEVTGSTGSSPITRRTTTHYTGNYIVGGASVSTETPVESSRRPEKLRSERSNWCVETSAISLEVYLNFSNVEPLPEGQGRLLCESWLCPQRLTTAYCEGSADDASPDSFNCSFNYHRQWNPLDASSYSVECAKDEEGCIHNDRCNLTYSTQLSSSLKAALVLFNGTLLLLSSGILYTALKNHVTEALWRRRHRNALTGNCSKHDLLEMGPCPSRVQQDASHLHENFHLQDNRRAQTPREDCGGVFNGFFIGDYGEMNTSRQGSISGLPDIPEESEEVRL